MFRYAECDYTRFMRFRRVFVLLFLLVPAGAFAQPSPREFLAALNALRLDPHSEFTISPKDHIELRQGDVVLSFSEGRLAFFQPFEGHVTGLVFSGLGHALAHPRDPVEKQQLANFLGAPILDQTFVSGYIRFTDDSGENLLAQLKAAGLTPVGDNGFITQWNAQISRLNPTHSLRILLERYTKDPRHFLHAGLDGVTTGPFDILLDDSRAENVFLGQARRVGTSIFYDVWASYAMPGFHAPKNPYDALHYQVDTSIESDNSLFATTSLEVRALTGTEQVVFVQLARVLKVESVSQPDGVALPFFQNEGLTEREVTTRGDDTLCVFLPKPPAAGETITLRLKYHGNVIADAGNGVLFVGARESWYPHYGDTAEFAGYDLSFRWPKRLRLVATGEKSGEHEEGDFRSATWKTQVPVPEAGFNLGEYAAATLTAENHTIEVYANRQLEQAIAARLKSPTDDASPSTHIPIGEFPVARTTAPLAPPSPADTLKQLAREIDSSIRFYEQYSGPFPFRNLGVSQIPGTFGQGWPGLVYLSTLSFLPPDAQQRAGLDTSGQEQFSDLVPFHEVAHQWWGNVVGWSSYRDQWMNEAIAAYLSLLFADSQKGQDKALRSWLERYRKRLITKTPNEEVAPADVGPLILGSRLSSSKSPNAYDVIVYLKGAWVMHMLREMLRQPSAKEPDARFAAMLRSLVVKYARTGLSTEQLQKEVEAVMTPSMDLEGGRSMEWFFDQYVRGTGIPHYKIEYTSKKTEKGFIVKGKLMQSEVPRSFIAPVPLYISAGGRFISLGTVVALGEETNFSFTTTSDPRKIAIDPHMTLLCTTE